MKRFITVLLGILAIGSAGAKTPDNQTPAGESICDSLKGQTRGLYGLCVVYCEAHDADSLSPSELSSPSEAILARYRDRMRDGDPDMPCLQQQEPPQPQAGCPCWTAEQLDAVPAPNTAIGADMVWPDACVADAQFDLLENQETGFFTVPRWQGSVQRNNVEGQENASWCMVTGSGYAGAPPAMMAPELPMQQAENCRGMLVARARKDAQEGIWTCWGTD